MLCHIHQFVHKICRLFHSQLNEGAKETVVMTGAKGGLTQRDV